MKYLTLWDAIWAAITPDNQLFIIREEKGQYEVKKATIGKDEQWDNILLNHGTECTKEEFESHLRTDNASHTLFKALYQANIE